MSSSCKNESVSDADTQMQKKTEQAMKEANSQVGYPAVTNFQEKKLLKMLYELRDKENYICHAYLVNEMKGTVGQYIGKCMGYGLPYSTQFSNPNRLETGGYSGSYWGIWNAST